MSRYFAKEFAVRVYLKKSERKRAIRLLAEPCYFVARNIIVNYAASTRISSSARIKLCKTGPLLLYPYH